LEARGLLDETLVLCLSEHGRTPKLNANPGGGRDHWSKVYCTAFAGGGMAGGKVVGRSDSIAGEVRDTPISPKDVLSTAFHLLGIDPHTTIPDRLNRPVPVAGNGIARPEFWS
jgi:arylsulfatase A-like enzyme